jgi:hypothetical protein
MMMDGAAGADRQVHRPPAASGMIERRGRQSRSCFAVLPELVQEIEHRQILLGAAAPAAGRQDAFGRPVVPDE